MKIRITTVRTLPGWDKQRYAADMAKTGGVPPHRIREFLETGKTSIIFGNPKSETYNRTTWEILEDISPVRSIDERNESEDDSEVLSE